MTYRNSQTSRQTISSLISNPTHNCSFNQIDKTLPYKIILWVQCILVNKYPFIAIQTRALLQTTYICHKHKETQTYPVGAVVVSPISGTTKALCCDDCAWLRTDWIICITLKVEDNAVEEVAEETGTVVAVFVPSIELEALCKQKEQDIACTSKYRSFLSTDNVLLLVYMCRVIEWKRERERERERVCVCVYVCVYV